MSFIASRLRPLLFLAVFTVLVTSFVISSNENPRLLGLIVTCNGSNDMAICACPGGRVTGTCTGGVCMSCYDPCWEHSHTLIDCLLNPGTFVGQGEECGTGLPDTECCNVTDPYYPQVDKSVVTGCISCLKCDDFTTIGTCQPDPYQCNSSSSAASTSSSSSGCSVHADCNDLVNCTVDTCDPATGCAYTPMTCSSPCHICEEATTTCVPDMNDAACLCQNAPPQVICGTRTPPTSPNCLTNPSDDACNSTDPTLGVICCAPAACQTASNGNAYCAGATPPPPPPPSTPCSSLVGCLQQICLGNISVCDDSDACTVDTCQVTGVCANINTGIPSCSGTPPPPPPLTTPPPSTSSPPSTATPPPSNSSNNS
ncbi:MAG: hypothetical protein O2904_04840, partial [bacterium]|nr:hypothetical protein [bacterium]